MAAQFLRAHTNTNNNNTNDGDNNSIFSEASNTSDIRWKWRTLLETERSDDRNSKYYANYIGSKGTRKYVQQISATTDDCAVDKKPAHHLKHLVKIGCPKHDLYPILSNALSLQLSPTTICTHKSWKCATHDTDYGILLHTLSFNEVGLEWRRGAFSQKPLEITYNDTLCTKLQMKRIANTNFNKIFRPGTYGNKPSLRNGSWKDGKAFYVFRDDKLTLSVTDCITVVFELSSSSTIEQTDSNKLAVIDGWRNVVGGVGFYSPPHSPHVIDTVLVLRKSMEFPMQCLQESKIKIYAKHPIAMTEQSTCTSLGKLVIGSRRLQLDLTLSAQAQRTRPHPNWSLDVAANHNDSSTPNTDSQSVTASTNSNTNNVNTQHRIHIPRASLPDHNHTTNSHSHLHSHSHSSALLEHTDFTSLLDMGTLQGDLPPFCDTQSVFPLDEIANPSLPRIAQSPLPPFLTDNCCLDMKNDDDINALADDQSATAYSYGPVHSGSYTALSQRYSPMRSYVRQATDADSVEQPGNGNTQQPIHAFSAPQYLQLPQQPAFDVRSVQDLPQPPLQRRSMSDNDRYRVLTDRINQLEALNIRVMDLNSRLTQERDQLLSRVERLQSTINQQSQQIQHLQQAQLHQLNQPQPRFFHNYL